MFRIEGRGGGDENDELLFACRREIDRRQGRQDVGGAELFIGIDPMNLYKEIDL